MTVQQLIEARVITILRGVPKDRIDATADALYAGGIRAIEVTFNTEGAAEMIEALKTRHAGRFYIGAGTVLDSETARTAILAGADFLLAPTFDPKMIATCNRYGKLAVPGVFTPTEMLAATECGAPIVKVFPAVTVGPTFFRQVRAPLQQIRTMAVGGITAENFLEYLQAGADCVGVANDIAHPDLIASGDFAALEARALRYTKALEAKTL